MPVRPADPAEPWSQNVDLSMAEPHAVPLPRTPANRPSATDADGAPARPAPVGRVSTASASVPSANRIAPPSEMQDQPIPLASSMSRPRVYGRAVQPERDQPAPADDPASQLNSPAAINAAAINAATINVAADLSGVQTSPPKQHDAPGEGQGTYIAAFGGSAPGPAYGANGHPPVGGHRPYGEYTTDMAGQGPPARPYGEHTTDLAGRGAAVHEPPAQASPPPAMPGPAMPGTAMPGTAMPGPAMPGTAMPDPAMQGPAARATVTPPDPSETTSWPGPASDEDDGSLADQSLFDSFKPEEPSASPAPPPHVRKLPVLVAVLAAAVLLVALPLSVVWLVAQSGDETFAPKPGDCVQKEGDRPVAATCGQPNTFTVVSTVDDKAKCADPGQPYIVNPTEDGNTEVLCLKPSD